MIDVSNIKIKPLLETLKILKIEDKDYFSNTYNAYISNSRLSLINPEQDGSPEAFFEGLSKHNIYSDSLLLGSGVHELILQPELFQLCETVERPMSKAGFMADELYKYYKNNTITEEVLIKASNKIGYYKDKFNKGRQTELISKCTNYWKSRLSYERTPLTKFPIYLDKRYREKVLGCVRALKSNFEINNLMNPDNTFDTYSIENEQAVLLDVRVEMPNNSFILKIKAKLDNYVIDKLCGNICVNDVKTLGKPIEYFKDNFSLYRYYRELSLYSWLLSLIAKKYYSMDNCNITSNCLIVSTIPNYNTSIYKVTKKDFYKGWKEFLYLFKLVAYYYDKGYKFK